MMLLIGADLNKRGLLVGENGAALIRKGCMSHLCGNDYKCCVVWFGTLLLGIGWILSINIKGTVRKVSEDISVEFKDKQLEAIKCLCARQDIFISFPTGYGNLTNYDWIWKTLAFHPQL